MSRMSVHRYVVLYSALVAGTSALGCSAGFEEGEEDSVGSQTAAISNAGPAITTQHNDAARSGANLSETLLNTSNVNTSSFGKLASRPLRGSVFAQPLYVPSVSIPGIGTRNILYVATMHNMVYAFDADNHGLAPYARVQLEPSISLPDPNIGPPGYKDTWGEIGITSTPVISISAGAMWLVAATQSGGKYRHILHKLSLSTLQNLVAPVTICSSGLAADGTCASGFTSNLQNQRSSLLLTNGVVYIAFAGYGDREPYQGWVFAYNASNLSRISFIATTPASIGQGGIWMAGEGPSADASSNVYFITGNGKETIAPAPPTLHSSFVKATLTGSTLGVSSWFSPSNSSHLDHEDGDLGGSGAVLVPNTNLLVGGGKEGVIYLLDRNSLGGRSPGDGQIRQRFNVRTPLTVCPNLSSAVCNHIHGSPIWWTGPNGPWMYVWAENDFLRAFRFDTSTQRFDCSGAAAPLCNPVSDSDTTSPEGVPGGSSGMPGGMLSISANGSAAGSGIVWASHPWKGNGNQQVVDGVLRAYDASNLRTELWHSKKVLADDVGAFAKFVAPTVTGGQVFLPTSAGMWGKTILNETSSNGPGLARLGDTLMLGWTGTDTRINVLSTSDGFNFGNKATLGDTSNFGPAMASGSNSVYLAWTGTDGHLNVMRSTSSTFAGATRLSQTGGIVPLVETSDVAPALVNANGRLVIAWKGNGNTSINLMSSADGVTFATSTKVTLAEQTLMPPALYFANSKLYLVWVGTNELMNVMTSTDGGLTFGGKVTLGDSASSRPALAALPMTGSTNLDVHLFWSGTEGNNTMNVATFEGGSTSGLISKQLFLNDSTKLGQASSVWRNIAFFAWTGLFDLRLNIARYNPGELKIYGRKF